MPYDIDERRIEELQKKINALTKKLLNLNVQEARILSDIIDGLEQEKEQLRLKMQKVKDSGIKY